MTSLIHKLGLMKRRSVAMRIGLILSISLSIVTGDVHAQGDLISPPKNIEIAGVPSIPATLVRDVDRYRGAYGLPLAGWSSNGLEIWLKGLSSVAWVSRVKSPGASPETSPIYIQSPGIYDLYFQPQNKYLAYTRDTNGDEQFQLYLYDIANKTSQLLSDGKSRNTEPVWSNNGDKIVYSSTPSTELGVNLRLISPTEKVSNRLLVQSSGSYLKAFDWSPDDSRIVYCDFTANTVSTLWLIDVASGKKVLLSPKSSKQELYDSPHFSNDGKGIYVITDHDSDMRRLAYIDLASKKITYVPSDHRWDVDEFRLSPNGKLLAFNTNEDGISRLHLFDLSSFKETGLLEFRVAVISDIKWSNDSNEIAVNVKSAQRPNDVQSVNISANKIELWSKSVTNGVELESLQTPELIHWNSFDKRTISGFVYRPPTRFSGKRPVIIDFHGGPEEQYRPTYGYEQNYFTNDLGIARIYPNVRGSSGFGRTFLDLDNGLRRQDAVKDIGALLEWIKSQPDLDSDRVLVEGSSYGGYLSLSVAYTYADRIRGAISDSGISNLASFVARTEGWRRGLQRSEFGDERDPKIKDFMERTAPLNNADKIKKPLLIIQGQNDPRVPVAEASSLVEATKGRIPVWFILAKDEGHGFAQQANRDYQLYATVMFVKEFLLK